MSLSLSTLESVANPSGHNVRKREEVYKEVCAKRLKQSVDFQTEEITQEENELLDADNWHRLYLVSRQRMRPISQLQLDISLLFYHCAVDVVRSAYLSVRKTQADIIEVLKYPTARSVLFQFAFCLNRMKECSISLRELRTALSIKTNMDNYKRTSTTDVNVQAEASVSSTPSVDDVDSSPNFKELDEGRGKCLKCTVNRLKSNENIWQTETLSTVEKFLLGVEEEMVELLGKQQKEESDIISNKIYQILVVLKEIITQMGIYPEVSEGDEKNMETTLVADNIVKDARAENFCTHDSNGLKAARLHREMERGQASFHKLIGEYFKSFQKKFETKGFVKRYYVDERSVKLMVVVEAAVRELYAEIKKEDSLLIELADYVCNAYACDTGEYELALASEEQRKIVTGELKRHLGRSVNYLSIFNQDMYMAFRKLIELIDPRIIWTVWRPRSRVFNECFK